MASVQELVSETFSKTVELRRRWKFSSSSVFYANPWLSLSPGTLYIVGTNPGGSPDIPAQKEADLLRLGTDKPWSLYLDESNWKSDNLQRNLTRLADLSVEGGSKALRKTFSTNAVFFRDDGRLKTMAAHIFEDFWPIHLEFLDRIRPSHILAFGNGADSAYQLIKGKLGAVRSVGSEIAVYNNFSIRASAGFISLPSGTLEVTLAGLPHLSRCNVASNPSALAEARARDWLPP